MPRCMCTEHYKGSGKLSPAWVNHLYYMPSQLSNTGYFSVHDCEKRPPLLNSRINTDQKRNQFFHRFTTIFNILNSMAQASINRYEVYFVEYDSLIGKDHHSLYVETDDLQKTGCLYHVTGSLLRGMKMEIKKDVESPSTSLTFKKMTRIACIRDQDLTLFEDVCRSTAPPKPQLSLSGKRIHPQEPLRTCQEWVTDVIETLSTAPWFITLPKVEISRS